VARVSLGLLSEVERGQKEASSELPASICDALDLELADLLAHVSLELRVAGAGRDGAVRPLAPSVPAADSPAADSPAATSPVAGQPVPEPALALVGAAPARSALRKGEAVSLAA